MKLNIRTLIIVLSVFLFILLFTSNTVGGQIFAYKENNVDADSNIDAVSNISGAGSTSVSSAQTKDGSSQTLIEKNTLSTYTSPWTNYKDITIDSTQVTEDLINYPLFLKLYDSDLKTKAQADGDDIAFFDALDQQLSHEIESYNPSYSGTQAELIVWVKTNISSTVDTVITMKYGNSTMTSNQDPEGVWNSNYAGVWHLDDVTSILDSTSNNNDGTANVSPLDSPALIQDGVEFNNPSSNQSVEIAHSTSLTLPNTLTVDFWFKPNDNTTFQPLISKSDGNNNGDGTQEDLYIALANTGEIFVSLANSGGRLYWYTGATMNTGVWHHITFSYDSSGSIGSLYVNGSLFDTFNYGLGALKTNTNPLFFGYNIQFPSEGFSGIIDEVRVSNTVRSSGWSEFNFLNQYTPSQTYTVSTEREYTHWDYYKNILIDNTKVAGDLKNFPILLDIYDSDLKTKAQTDGDDIAFFSEYDHQLSHQIIEYDPNYNSSHARLYVWVTSDLKAASDTRIVMKYGNSALSNQEDYVGVWRSAYENVWHLDETPSDSSADIIDSMLKNNGTSVGSMGASDVLSGKIGTAVEFDGTNDLINVGQLGSNDWTGLTMSAWVYKYDTGDDRIFSASTSTSPSDSIYGLLSYNSFETFSTRIGTDGTGGSVSTTVSSTAGSHTLNNWQQVVVTWDAATGQITIYVDGQYEYSEAKGGESIVDTTEPAVIGNVNDNPLDNRFFSGIIDEVRVGSKAVSLDWVQTEFNNQDNPQSFFMVGSELTDDYELPVESSTAELGINSDTGSHSNFGDMRVLDGTYDTLTEISPLTNTHSLSSSTSSDMRVGDGTISWGSTSGTISFWVDFSSVAALGNIWFQTGSFEIDFSNTGRMKADWGAASSVVSNTIITTSTWYFVAVTWDEATNEIHFYLGDQNNAPTLDAQNLNWLDSVSSITGIVDNDFMQTTSGLGDELRYYDTMRSLEEIQSDYNIPLTGSEPNLRSYYKMDNNFIDLGPDGNNGVAEGVTSFSSQTAPTIERPSEINTQVKWEAFPGQVAEGTLAIFTGTTDAEDILVDYWTGSTWSNLFTDLTPQSWNNISVSGLIPSNEFIIRFRDGTPTSDTTVSTWQIDVVLLQIKNYQLEWEHQANTVDTTKEEHILAIYGSSTSGEDFEVQMWNSSSGSWLNPFGTTITSTTGWYNYSLTGLSGVINTNTYWRYRGTQEIKDDIQDTLSIDYAAIISYNNPPTLSLNPPDFQYTEGTTGHSISWDANDDNPGTYEIFRNTVSIQSGPWSNPVPITADVDGLQRGSYNYTIVIYDSLGSYLIDTVWVDVLDETNPSLNSPSDFSMNEGDVTSVTWTVSDLHPDTYVIYQNGSSVQSNSWTSGSISRDLSVLSIGYYNFTIVISDDSANIASDTVFVTINDVTNPTIASPGDQAISEGSTGNTISWTAQDNYPSTYVIYRNGTQINSSTWLSNIEVQENIDGLSKGVYNFTITFFDSSGNSLSDTVILSVNDTTIPVVNSPPDISYEQGSGTNPRANITWNLNDLYPNTYTIERDGVFLLSGSWIPGDLIIYVDGLTAGEYNYTIIVNDDSANTAVDTVIVTVTDSTAPVLSTPANQQISEVSTGNRIKWVATDANPANYNIYQNGSIVASSTWLSGATLQYNLDSLVKGTYNFTIYVNDISGNFAVDTVYITVIDTTNPLINHPTDLTYESGSTSNSISWTGTDSYPATYVVYRDTLQVDTNSWNSGAPITVNVDGLVLGTYNYTIVLLDESGNSIADTVWVIVEDTTAPIISDIVGPVVLNETSTGNVLSWTPNDLNPNNYRIYRNGTQVKSGAWIDNIAINYNLDSLVRGVYNFTILITDDGSNKASDQVIVVVLDETLPAIIPPSDLSYAETTTGNSISWTVSDAHPSNFVITRNGTTVLSSTWTSGTISINVDNLGLGTYNYTIIITDTSGNSKTNLVWVTVYDGNTPLISHPVDDTYSEGSTGNTLTWVGTDLHAKNYEIYQDMVLNSTGTWISGAEIVFSTDGLLVGVYNITIVIYDTSGNSVSDTVYVTVINAPTFDIIPDDLYYVVGTSNKQLSWTLSDSDPNWYLLYLDDVLVQNGSWSSGSPIVANVTGLSINNYNYTLVVNDTEGNYVQDTAYVIVSDLPVWDTPLPADIADYIEGSTGNEIIWNATDMFPDTYQVYLNGTPYGSPGTWDNASVITVNIDGLSIGTYNFSIYVQDTVNNTISDWVLVTVNDVKIPNITNAQPDIPDYKEGTTPHSISWSATDLHAGIYTIYVNDTATTYSVATSGSWASGVTVNWNIDGLAKGYYNYTIIFYDTSGNFNSSTAWVTVLDLTAPVISSPADFSYSEGTTGHWINWTATDNYPASFTVYRNTSSSSYTVFNTSSWLSGISINNSIDTLNKGLYNFTIVVVDASGNSIIDTVWVTVTDDTAPTFSTSSGDLSFANMTTGHILSWTFNDSYPAYYAIYQNGTQTYSSTWSDAIPINYNVDYLGKGYSNFTIVVYDESGNSATNTLFVTVSDTTAPVVSSPADLPNYQEGITTGDLSWTATDYYPDMYILYQNMIPIDTGNWTSGVAYNWAIDGLALGTYNYTVMFYDQSGNWSNDTVWVTVNDVTIPSITNTQTDIPSYIEGDTPYSVSWTATDVHAGTYTIYVNDTATTYSVATSGSWASGVAVNWNIDGLVKGYYNYTIIFYDTSGNFNSSTAWVTVLDQTAPVISSPADFSYSEGTTGHWINWTATDLYSATYIVYVNDTASTYSVFTSGSWTSGVAINNSIDTLNKGLYNFTIVVVDASGNSIIDTVWVTVTDDTAPVITQTPSTPQVLIEGTTGNWLNWSATDNYPANYKLIFGNNLTEITNLMWTSGVSISFNIDYFLEGSYNITVIFYDESNNFVSHFVEITVNDETNPTIVLDPTIPSNQYTEESTGNILRWNVSDIHADTYLFTRNTTDFVDSGPWNSGNIEFNIDGLSQGYYNFTLVIYDNAGNMAFDTIFITVVDETPPTSTHPVDFSFAEGSSNNWLNWTVSDLHPASYIIYQNVSTVVGSGTWNSSGEVVSVFLDTHLKGIYNFTLVIYDEAGNSVSDTVFVTVIDDTNPTFSSTPDDFSYEEVVSTGNFINWTAIDNYNSTYEIYQGGSQVDNGTWNSNSVISYNVDGLNIGVYSFTLVVYDESGLSASDSVKVTVYEVTEPSIVQAQNNVTYTEYSVGNYLSWNVFDLHPSQYVLYSNEGQFSQGTWTNGLNITVNVDGLLKGLYNFTILISDTSDNVRINTVFVSVVDTTAPLINPPVDFNIEIGSVNELIIWTATDNYPNTYLIYRNGTKLGQPSIWMNNEPIFQSMSNLGLGAYNFTLAVTDESGNTAYDTVIVTVVDTTPPVLHYQTPDYSYAEGTTGHEIKWNFTDITPGPYIVYNNGSQIQTNNLWSNKDFITVVVDGELKGIHIFTIIVYDEAGNSQNNSIVITVTDDTDPIFVETPQDLTYVEQSTGNTLQWTISDDYPGTVMLYQNGSLFDQLVWTKVNEVAIFDVDGLAEGNYNFTVIIQDASGNTNTDTVYVQINDETRPVFALEPEQFDYIEGNTGYSLTWIGLDLHPAKYNLTQDGSNFASGSWTSGEDLSFNIDGLAWIDGAYNFSIIIYDESNNNHTSWILIDVSDITKPQLVEVPTTTLYFTNVTGNTISWVATELHPGAYYIKVNGQINQTRAWDGSKISFSLNGFAPEYYNISIKITDGALNSITHWIKIRVKDPQIIDTIRPELDLNSTVFEGDVDLISGIWTDIDGNSIPNAEITLWLSKQEPVQTLTFTTSSNGSYTLRLDYSDLVPGIYQWRVEFKKEGYQTWNDYIIPVQLLPHNYQIDLSASVKLEQGKPYNVVAYVRYNNRNATTPSTWLSLNGQYLPKTGGVVGIEVLFTLNIRFENGQAIIRKTVETNENGVALLTLSPDETRNIISVTSINAEIGESNTNNPVSKNYEQDRLPEIILAAPDPLVQMWEFAKDNYLEILAGLSVLIIIAAIYLLIRRRRERRIEQLNDIIKFAVEELRGVETLQQIMIMSKNKVTLYEEKLFDESVNTSLVSGMITAFSAFLNELSEDKDQANLGFETMERRGVSITISKGLLSNFIVMSETKLPYVILTQMREAQKLIETEFRKELEEANQTSRQLTKDQVHPVLYKAELKSMITRELRMNKRNINAVLREKSLSRVIKQNMQLLSELPDSRYATDEKFEIGDFLDFYGTKGVTRKVASRLFMLAFHFDIIEPVNRRY